MDTTATASVTTGTAYDKDSWRVETTFTLIILKR